MSSKVSWVVLVALAGLAPTSPAQTPIYPGDSCLVNAKWAPLKKGDDVLGYLQRGTTVQVEKVVDGFARVTIDKGYLNRRQEDLFEPRLSNTTVSGYLETTALLKRRELNAGTEQPKHDAMAPVYSLINSYNGGLPSTSQLALKRGIQTGLLVLTFEDVQSNHETRATLSTMIAKLKDLEKSTGLNETEKRAVKKLLESMEGVETGLTLDRRIAEISRDQYLSAVRSSDEDRAVRVGGAIALACAQEYGTALRVGLSALSEDPKVEKEKTLIESKERARDAIRKLLFHQLEEINVIAETLWQVRSERKQMVDCDAILVSCDEDAYFTSRQDHVNYLHDRITLWNGHDKALTNCMLNIELRGGDRTVNCYQWIDRWEPGMPLYVRPTMGHKTKYEGVLGRTTCNGIKSMRILVACDQSEHLLNRGYEHAADEKRWTAWQELRDIEMKVESETFSAEYDSGQGIALLDKGQKVLLWLESRAPLRNVTFEVQISDIVLHEVTREVTVENWVAGKPIEVYFKQDSKDRWVPTTINVKVLNKRHGVHIAREVKP